MRPLLAALVVSALVAPGLAWAAGVPGALHLVGTASSFNLGARGEASDGGTADWTFYCVSCNAGFYVTAVDQAFALRSGTVFTQLPAGSYSVAGFAGYISYTYHGPGEIFIQLDGVGDLWDA